MFFSSKVTRKKLQTNLKNVEKRNKVLLTDLGHLPSSTMGLPKLIRCGHYITIGKKPRCQLNRLEIFLIEKKSPTETKSGI